MIALFNLIPHYCPACGTRTGLDRQSNNSLAYYKARQTITCSCGLRYQLITEQTDLLRAATASGGDMLNYYMQDDANRNPNPN